MRITVEVLTAKHFAHITVDERCKVSVLTLEGEELCTDKVSEEIERIVHKLVATVVQEIGE